MTSKQSMRLADGRELIYFDDEPGADRSARDSRDLPDTASTSQARWDPLFQDWSVNAGHRQARTYKPPTDDCPLDPTRAGRPTEIPAPDCDVVVFENRFPSLESGAAALVPLVAEFPFSSGAGVGRCRSSASPATTTLPSPSHRCTGSARWLVDAWIDRTEALWAVSGVEYVFAFENRGEEIGVTLSHPHGQIYGYPFVPPRFTKVVDAAAAHRAEHGSCLQCDIAEAETKHGERVVLDSEHFLVYVPFGARWPYEARIVPHRHVPTCSR